jgi:putative addiction module component (TIGR02574 family)
MNGMSSVITHFQGKAVPLDTQAVRTAALALSPEERVDLAEQLMLSLDDDYLAEVKSAQIVEIERRLANDDESNLIPLDEAMKMAKARQKP